jgi:hypothetical protein
MVMTMAMTKLPLQRLLCLQVTNRPVSQTQQHSTCTPTVLDQPEACSSPHQNAHGKIYLSLVLTRWNSTAELNTSGSMAELQQVACHVMNEP